MIVDWLAQTPALVVAGLVVSAPGLLALFGAGLRGLALGAFAPVFSIAATAIAALVFGQVGLPWSPLTWVLAMLVFVAVAWLVGRMLGPAPTESADLRWVLVFGLFLGALFAGWRLISYISDPDGISQTNDAVFHMNAVRYILETTDASSMHVNAVIGGRSFYPAAWHGVTALIVMASGVSIPVAANIFTVVIGAVIWPLGIAWLARSVFRSDVVAGYAAVLASALQAFPLLMFQWGVLFPNALSTALVPAALAMVVSGSSWVRESARWEGWVRLGLFTLVAAAALLLAQPAAFLPWAAMSVVWLSYAVVKHAEMLGIARALMIVTAAWVVLTLVWVYLARGTSGSHWPPFRNKFEALFDVLLNGQVRMPIALAISVLMLVGLAVTIRRRELRWFAVSWAGISLLYVLVAAVGNAFVRESILGAWYADPYRIAALAPIAAIPLAALGLDALIHFFARRFGRKERAFAVALAGLCASVVVMIVIVCFRGVAMPAFLEATFDRESRYLAASDAYLNPDERALLEELPDLVDEDQRVLGNPSTGAGFGYVLSGLDVYPRTWSPPKSDAWAEIAERLREAGQEDSVCEALEVYGDPAYVLDFGPSGVGPGKYPAPGMTDFDGQDGFELVAREGAASLWRITACAR